MTLASCLQAGPLAGYECDPTFGGLTRREVFNASQLAAALQQSNSWIVPMNQITLSNYQSIIGVDNVFVDDPNRWIILDRTSNGGSCLHFWGCTSWVINGVELDGNNLANWGLAFGMRWTADTAGGATAPTCFDFVVCNMEAHHVAQGAIYKIAQIDGLTLDHCWGHDTGARNNQFCEILYIGQGGDDTAFSNNILVTDCILEKSGTQGPGTGEIFDVKSGTGKKLGTLTDPKAPGNWDVVCRRTIMRDCQLQSQAAFVAALHGQGVVGPRILLLDSMIDNVRRCTSAPGTSSGCFDGAGVWKGDGDMRIQGTTISNTDDAGIFATNVAAAGERLDIVHSTITGNGQGGNGEASLMLGENMSWQPDEAYSTTTVDCCVFDDLDLGGNPSVSVTSSLEGQTSQAVDGNLLPFLGGPAEGLCAPYTDACGQTGTFAGARQRQLVTAREGQLAIV